ncbi:MAG: DUF58 domain-containing protein [Candidatus Delongbacteria bacterium]|jgi:uncharacterized protein (DUF58 family)|nr:DUF58 domain-containing protein [Candidatus Delongbacteria bacterium]
MPVKNLRDIQQFEEFDHLELIAKHVVEGFITGLHKSPYHGFSVEFAEHRQYNKGEPTKHIDWKLYARTDKLFVKRYEEETNLRAHLIIDISSSMLFPLKEKRINKLTYSVYVAAALIYLMKRQRDAVGISLFDEEVRMHTDARLSQVHLAYLYNEMRQLISPEFQPEKRKTSTAETLNILAEQIKKRSLIVLFSDMFSEDDTDELFSALQHLRFNKHEVILFHVTDHELEQEFEFSNRPHKFIDLETGKQVRLNPNEVRGQYKKQSHALVSELKTRCGQYQIDFVEADIRKDFTEVLQAYLLKRTRLY